MKEKFWKYSPLIFLFLLFIILPFEPQIDKAHRSLMYAYTNVSKGTIKSLYFYISDLLILFYFFLCCFKIRHFSFAKNGAFLLFFLAIPLSIYCGEFHATIWHHMQISYWLLLFILFVIVQDAFSKNALLPFLKILMMALVCIGTLEALMGSLQYLTQGALGLRFLGEHKLNADSFSRAGFYMADGSLTLFDHLFGTLNPRTIMRSYGTFSHPNVFGGFLVVSLFSTYSLYMLVQKKSVRLFLFLCSTCMIFALFTTFSRSALFSFLATSLLWLFYARKEKIFLLTTGVLASILVSLIVLFPQITERGGVVNYNSVAKTSDTGRLRMIDFTKEMVKAAPLTGVGFGNFEKAGKKLWKDSLKNYHVFVVHNIYLLIITEMGIIGLLSFLLFLYFPLKAGFKGSFDPKVRAFFCSFVALLLIGFFDYYPIFFHEIKFLFILFAAFLSALPSFERNFVEEYVT